METTPMSIKNRPFSIEPNTGIMLPDGIFDVAIFEQKITSFYTNNSSSDLKDVSIYIEGISDISIAIASQTYFFPIIPSGASVKVSWLGNFKNASIGKKNVSIIAKSKGFALKREIKQIFVTRTTFDTNSNTYTCQVPEGSINVKIIGVITEKNDRCNKDSKFPPIWLPVKVEFSVSPNPNYEGQFGDLPFQDPWWKVVGWIVFALASIGAFIAAALGGGKASVGAGGSFDETSGTVSCCKPEDGLSVKDRLTIAGVLSTIASGALIVGCADDKDPWRRGQEATPIEPGEITISESLKLNITYLEAPQAGKPYPVEVDWTYKRFTNIKEHTFHVHEIRNNIHTLKEVKVDTPSSIRLVDNKFTIKASFIKEDGRLFLGSQLYAFALVISPKNNSYFVNLLDDGILYDTKANDGIYTGHLDIKEILRSDYLRRGAATSESDFWGYWRVYVYAQDINDATPDMKPTEAATHIGGMMIASASELTFDNTLPCPLKANNVILVTA